MKHLKQEFDKLTFKEAIIYSMAVISLIAGFVMLFMGMFIPPEGQIHDSVLTAFGIILLFVSTLMGVSLHYSNELTKFKTRAIDIVREASRVTTDEATDGKEVVAV